MAQAMGVEQADRPKAPPWTLPAWQLRQWAGYLTAPLVVSALMAIWLLAGVSIGEAARFMAFEVIYVLLPGCLLYALLSPTPGGPLRVLALGWPLGYALEIGAFALTATLHIRGAFAFLPLAAAIAIGPYVMYKHGWARPATSWLRGALRDRGLGRPSPGGESLLAGIAIAIAFALLAFRFFATYPLPEHARSAFYFLDNVEYVSLAAEALHHWPITEPFLAGHPFRYYTGVFMHIAAIKQVMGVSPATTVFRLLPATELLVAALQFWCLGGLLGRSRWAGPVTVALLIVVENIKLYPTHTKMFGVALFSEFTWSPSYGLGVIFFLSLLILLRTRLLSASAATAGPRPKPAGLRPWPAGSASPGTAGTLALLAVLVLGGSALNAPAVAAFIGGLGLFWLWRVATGRVDRLLFHCLVLSLGCFGATYLLMLSGSSSLAGALTEFAPLNFLKYTVFASTLVAHPGLAPLLGVAVVMCVWKLLPVLGAVWPLPRREAWSSYVSFALATFLVGSVVYVFMGSIDDNEIYFIWYGYIAVIPVATVSLMYLWKDIAKDTQRAIIRVCVATLMLGLVIAGSTQILTASGALAGVRRASRFLWYGGTLGLAGGLVLLWSVRLERLLTPRVASRGVRVAACGALLLGVLGCAESVVLAVPQTWRTILDRQVVPQDSKYHPGITATLYRGLVWVREHTGECDLLAANTHEVVSRTGASKADSEYFYYSAFTERRVLLESWIITYRGLRSEQPYPGLYALNNAATRSGSPVAVRELARRGVSYILIDKSHEGDVREPSSVSRLVFSNSALDVYRVTAPVGIHSC
jgi:hypothetical protein